LVVGDFSSRALEAAGLVGGNFFKTRVPMFRTIRILLATPVYLFAYLVLIVALRLYPPEVREDARKSFL